MRYAKVDGDTVTEIHLVADAEDNGDPTHGEAFLAGLWGGVFKQTDTAVHGATWDGTTFTNPVEDIAAEIKDAETELKDLEAKLAALKARQ